MNAPKENPASNVNRKRFYSILLQGVYNVDMVFTDCYAGEVGSVHDAFMF